MSKYINGRHIGDGELEQMQLQRMQSYLADSNIRGPKKIDNYWVGHYPGDGQQVIPRSVYKPPFPG